MKLAGLTWWRNNYGSILQAYALQKQISSYENVSYEIINQYSKKMVSFENLIIKLKTVGLQKTSQRLIGRFGIKKLRNRVANLQKFVDENLIVSDFVYSEENISEANKQYDGFICGSDQIWNPTKVTLDSIYWLGFVEREKKKIAYAPSIGVNRVNDYEASILCSNLQDFDALSCREESGTQLINEILKMEVCATVLDPTLIVDRIIWDKMSSTRVYPQKYIFAYLLIGTKAERRLIEEFAKEKNLPIVTMPFLDGEKLIMYDFKFGDYKLWDGSPEDFISAIRFAEYVFTDSFHCMIFSCLYHKTFYTFPKYGNAQLGRITGLQTMLKTGNRMISSDMNCDELIKMKIIPWNIVDSVLNSKRTDSQKYLYEAIFK